MASVRTAIELQDNFTSILYQVIDSVNLGLSAMEDLHQTMNNPVDTASFESARDSINQATIAVQQLDAAMQGMEVPDAQTPSIPQNPAPVNIPVHPIVPDPLVEQPEPVQIPVRWQSYEGLDVFTNTGAERFEQEIASVHSMMERLSETQVRITQQANEAEILSPQASYDVQNVENRMQALAEMIDQAENNPLNIGTEEANTQLERLRMQLNQTLQLQNNLDAAMRGMDISEINAAYLRLSQNVTDTERLVRDSFSNIPPVEIPVHWHSDTLPVFTGSGMERFEQEVRSANHMLNALHQTQSRITETAENMDFLPPGGLTDLTNMQNRLQAIQQRIQTIENNPLTMGTDAANAELERLRGQLDQAISEQQELNRAVDNMDVAAANEAYLRLSQTIGGTERYIRDNVEEQVRFNQEIGQGTQEANTLMQTIKGAIAAYATIQTLSAGLSLSDTLASTTARLNMMNDGLQTTQDLQNMIFLSAERARGSYQATADAVSKLGLMAGDAFGSSEEIIAFMEQVNKQFTIAGTEAAGIEAAMLQLTQAMGSGVLRGEEYNSILEQAPNIIQAIADYMEVPKGQLKDMAAEGQITADIVKAAMFAAADDTNAKFEQMPMTFEQIGTSLKNTVMMSLQPLLENLNEIANSEAFQQLVDHAAEALSALVAVANPIIEQIANSQALWDFANGAIDVLSMVGTVALGIFSLLVTGANLIADNWSWISPIIYGVAGALAVYYSWQMAVNAIQAISKGIKIAMCIAAYAYAAATGAEVSATAAATAAQYELNTAMYACPIMWIIILIIALVALFYAAVAAVNKFAGTSVSATGIICGVFMTAAAFIGNIFVALINFAIDIFVVLWNFIAAFANFFGNVFNDPVGSIARLFFDLVDGILGLLESLASAIDTIFGSNLAGAVAGWRNSLGSWVDETFGQGEEVMEKINGEDWHLEGFDYGDAWDAGYSFGEGIDESIKNFDISSLFGTDNIPSPDEYMDLSNYGSGLNGIGGGIEDIGGGVEDIAGNTGAIAGDTGAMADAMEITGEELKYLRDIAEQEAINRYTTAEINIEQTNHNSIKNGMDLDGIMSGMTDMVNEAIDISTEGVHT